MATRNIKWAILLACLLLPIGANAQDRHGFYTMFELGGYQEYLQSRDKQTKVKQKVGTIHAQWGYEWQSGWQLGLDGVYAGAGTTHSLSGTQLLRGGENLPYRHNDGALAVEYHVGLQLGYHLIRSTDHDMYVRFFWNIMDFSYLSYAFPLTAQDNYGSFRLEVENRHSLMPKMSVGYTLGAALFLDHQIKFGSMNDDDFIRLGQGEDIEVNSDHATWGLYGDVKWIYHASKSTDFFVKWDIKANFAPKSEAVRTSVYDIRNNRSLGEVSLHIPDYRVIRSGIYFGVMF